MSGQPGYFTETFCRESRFVHPRNGERVDAIRDEIARKGLPPELEASCWSRSWRRPTAWTRRPACRWRTSSRGRRARTATSSCACRALLPRARDGEGRGARGCEAADAVQVLEGDVAYLDPPYNQHTYLGNYHVWETLVRWDAPEAYGIACKRVDCRTRKSAFNREAGVSRPPSPGGGAVQRAEAGRLVHRRGIPRPRRRCESILAERGHVAVLAHDYKRYVGAQIGIHNPKGERVGTVGNLRNREFLFLVGPEPVSVGQQEHFEGRLRVRRTEVTPMAKWEKVHEEPHAGGHRGRWTWRLR